MDGLRREGEVDAVLVAVTQQREVDALVVADTALEQVVVGEHQFLAPPALDAGGLEADVLDGAHEVIDHDLVLVVEMKPGAVVIEGFNAYCQPVRRGLLEDHVVGNVVAGEDNGVAVREARQAVVQREGVTLVLDGDSGRSTL